MNKKNVFLVTIFTMVLFAIPSFSNASEVFTGNYASEGSAFSVTNLIVGGKNSADVSGIFNGGAFTLTNNQGSGTCTADKFDVTYQSQKYYGSYAINGGTVSGTVSKQGGIARIPKIAETIKVIG